MITLFFTMGAQGRVPLSLSACFLEAGGLPFEILDIVGQFFTIATNSSLVTAILALFATSCSSTDLSLTTAAARLSNYPSRAFMTTSSTPLFVSTSLVL